VVHSLKGNSSMMGLQVIAAICHEMETVMEDTLRPPRQEQIQELSKRWAVLEHSLSYFLRDRQGRHIIVARAEYEKVVHKMVASGKSDVAEMLKEWELEALDTHFDRIEEQVRSLASTLHKGEVVFKRAGG